MTCPYLEYRHADATHEFEEPRACCTAADRFVQAMRADICNDRFALDHAIHCEIYREHEREADGGEHECEADGGEHECEAGGGEHECEADGGEHECEAGGGNDERGYTTDGERGHTTAGEKGDESAE